MGKPNIYKARVGLMDITFKELAFIMRERGMKIKEPEISAAIHGGRQAKHVMIRNVISQIYSEWKADAVKNYGIDFTKIV